VRAWVPALLVLALPPAVAGQAAPDRAGFDRFRDSLAGVRDTSALRALQRSLSSHPDPAATIRFALVALRRADLQADPDASDARDALRALVRRTSDWPLAWHLLAQAEQRRAGWERSDPLALGNRVGAAALERALEAERRALEADPRFTPAAVALASLALGLHDTAFYLPAREALRRAELAQARPPTAVLLARGRLERATDETDSALTAFERAAADCADRSAGAMARLEWVRTALAAGSARGDSLYFSGAASEDSAVVAGYRDDLAPIAPDSDLASFDAARGTRRTDWLRQFWSDRDRAEFRADGDRLREHYRRLLYARRHFALTVTRRFYGGQDAYRSGSDELDDRGAIYIRHGEPAARLRPFVFGLMPNETWRYDRADGDLLFHFSAGYDESGGGDLYDYRLVESVLDLRGAGEAPLEQLLLSRETLSPLYGRMLHWGPNGAARSEAGERSIGRASISYGTATDSYELQFARRLTAYADLVAIGTDHRVPLVQFVFAVAAVDTTPSPELGVVGYAVRARVALLDGGGHAVAHADTTLSFGLDRALARHQYLLGRVELPVPAGRFTWRAALTQGNDAGVVLPRDSVTVRAAGPALSLSDLALGIRAASARWQPTPADTVLLTPIDLFRAGSQVELYYEVSGARPGDGYRHEIGVFKVRGDDRVEERPVVALHVDEAAPGAVIRAHRLLQLARLKPGRYVVEVKVTGPGGATDSRGRAIRVVKPDR
jgi:GWxTD domain-containing protein